MFITSRESAMFPELFPDPVSDQFASLATRTPLPRQCSPARGCADQPRPPWLSGRLPMSRAYISPERPWVEANLRVLCPFSGIPQNAVGGGYLYVVVYIGLGAIRSSISPRHPGAQGNR